LHHRDETMYFHGLTTLSSYPIKGVLKPR